MCRLGRSVSFLCPRTRNREFHGCSVWDNLLPRFNTNLKLYHADHYNNGYLAQTNPTLPNFIYICPYFYQSLVGEQHTWKLTPSQCSTPNHIHNLQSTTTDTRKNLTIYPKVEHMYFHPLVDLWGVHNVTCTLDAYQAGYITDHVVISFFFSY